MRIMKTDINRREFLKGTAWMLAVAETAGCTCLTEGCGIGGSMHGFACAPLKNVRVGVIGLGMRGSMCIDRLAIIPGMEITMLCDLYPERTAAAQAKLRALGKRPAEEVNDPEGWKRVCDSDRVDVVYSPSPWALHVPVALRAMRSGKHVFLEVPAAFRIDDCWELVETAEKTKRHCMQLENCCYGEEEMVGLALARNGRLGEVVHAECDYIHDLRNYCYREPTPRVVWEESRNGTKAERETGYWDYWRLKLNAEHKGNMYPTHGLGPVCQVLNVNRGDRLDYLCSLESNQFNFEAYAKLMYPADDWRRRLKVEMGDMNMTLVKTMKGKSILIRHDVSSPRPYQRFEVLSGTNGIYIGYPYRKPNFQVVYAKASGEHLGAFWQDEAAKKVWEENYPNLWKKAGAFAKAVGGHGGKDFIMDLRWAYCLQNGLPMDLDVYDLATWSSICELSERSVRGRKYVDVPDFTRGGWKTAKPFEVVDFDVEPLMRRISGANKTTQNQKG